MPPKTWTTKSKSKCDKCPIPIKPGDRVTGFKDEGTGKWTVWHAGKCPEQKTAEKITAAAQMERGPFDNPPSVLTTVWDEYFCAFLQIVDGINETDKMNRAMNLATSALTERKKRGIS